MWIRRVCSKPLRESIKFKDTYNNTYYLYTPSIIIAKYSLPWETEKKLSHLGVISGFKKYSPLLMFCNLRNFANAFRSFLLLLVWKSGQALLRCPNKITEDLIAHHYQLIWHSESSKKWTIMKLIPSAWINTAAKMAVLEERKGCQSQHWRLHLPFWLCCFPSSFSTFCVLTVLFFHSTTTTYFLYGGSILTALRSSAEPEGPGGGKGSSCSKRTELAETVKGQKLDKDPKYWFSDIHRHTTAVNCQGRGSCAPPYLAAVLKTEDFYFSKCLMLAEGSIFVSQPPDFKHRLTKAPDSQTCFDIHKILASHSFETPESVCKKLPEQPSHINRGLGASNSKQGPVTGMY